MLLAEEDTGHGEHVTDEIVLFYPQFDFPVKMNLFRPRWIDAQGQRRHFVIHHDVDEIRLVSCE